MEEEFGMTKPQTNSHKNKIIAGVIVGLLFIIAIIIITTSQQQSVPLYMPYKPQWKVVDTFEISGGESHSFSCPQEYWEIEWTMMQGWSDNSIRMANLYCGTLMNPPLIDSFDVSSGEGSKVYNENCGSYILEIPENGGWWVINILAYY